MLIYAIAQQADINEIEQLKSHPTFTNISSH